MNELIHELISRHLFLGKFALKDVLFLRLLLNKLCSIKKLLKKTPG